MDATSAASTPLRRLAGGALVLAPALLFGGMLTSPPQADDSSEGYLASLAADYGVSLLSANLFHYGWVLVALGVPATLTLLRGPRGRGLTGAGVALSAFGAIQMSGMLLSDWFTGAMPNAVPLADAARVFDTVTADPSLALWRLSGILFGVAMLPLLMAGLARAGVVGWWTVPVILLPFVAAAVLPATVGAVVALACYSPLVLVGVRLLARSQAGVIRAEELAASNPV
ncbi:hypothetical protein [Spongiactinospora sp. TRM90649]|uniref:hypothetical protein n=1 Tax=Spongiactinospora sp. TRM90649 TaxID=3031114 RepID=UPI0023F8F4BE|nr:hypothetical protein [Spongiactinospora sp. TRM90649]MDF5754986.1 hypothetical protein [Spongiactinospora sp. TRM90649]